MTSTSRPLKVLFPSLLGYGAQFNNHLYAPITPSRNPADRVPRRRGEGQALQPQLVRIFYNDNWEENRTAPHPEWRENYASFVKVVRARPGGGRDDRHQLPEPRQRAPDAGRRRDAKFADALEDLVQPRVHERALGRGRERAATRGAVTLERVQGALPGAEARARRPRSRDRIPPHGRRPHRERRELAHHYEWLKWIADDMGDLVDAYAEHIYWWYTARTARVPAARHLQPRYNVLPPKQRKPVYMMEFGVRGDSTAGPSPRSRTSTTGAEEELPGDLAHEHRGVPAALVQRRRRRSSASPGRRSGTHWGRYDRSSANNQLYWMIGPPDEGYRSRRRTTRCRCSSARPSPAGRSSGSHRGSRTTSRSPVYGGPAGSGRRPGGDGAESGMQESGR